MAIQKEVTYQELINAAVSRFELDLFLLVGTADIWSR